MTRTMSSNGKNQVVAWYHNPRCTMVTFHSTPYKYTYNPTSNSPTSQRLYLSRPSSTKNNNYVPFGIVDLKPMHQTPNSYFTSLSPDLFSPCTVESLEVQCDVKPVKHSILINDHNGLNDKNIPSLFSLFRASLRSWSNDSWKSKLS